MRPLTPFGSYLDNAGHPLVGRVRFCNPDASPAEVFAEDGTTSLGSSVFTDSSGRPVQQPFLEDHDYLLFFDKYVGHATMTEDDDTDSWEEQGSAIDRYDVFGVSVECGTVVSVSNIAALRETAHNTVTPFDGVYMVDLLGYDEVGDKPVIRYVWDAESAESDDGGSVIAVDGIETGRWVIKDRPEFVDSRHFGAFPNSTATAYPTQRYNLQRAALWAHENNLGLYLYADETRAYYDISGINIYDLKCEDGATVFSINGSVSNIIGIKSVKVHSGEGLEGTTVLSDSTVRTSWAGDSSKTRLSPTERLVIDSTLRSVPGLRSWSDIAVDIYDNTNGDISFTNCLVNVYVTMDTEKVVNFDSCTFVAAKTMDGHLRFDSCHIPANVFVDDFDASNCSVTNCTVAPADEWEDVKDWLELKMDNGDWEYDFCGAGFIDLLISKPVGSTGTLVVRNARNIVLKASGTIPKIDLIDCTNTIISVMPSTSKLYVNGGSVDGNFYGSDEVYFANATVSGSYTIYSSVGADGCVFTPSAAITASNIRLSNCRADAGSVFAENGVENGGSLYENSSVSGTVTGVNTVVRNSHVGTLSVIGIVAGSTYYPWYSVIENSTVDDCRLQVQAENKPAFKWTNSSIKITQYGARYDIQGPTYVKEWVCEGCDVSFGKRKFYRRGTFLDNDLNTGDIKFLKVPVTIESVTYIPCIILDGLLVFENFHRYTENTNVIVANYFGYQAKVLLDAGTGGSEHFHVSIGRLVNIDGTLCLYTGLGEFLQAGDGLYADYDIDM